jgi:hypothetical protein
MVKDQWHLGCTILLVSGWLWVKKLFLLKMQIFMCYDITNKNEVDTSFFGDNKEEQERSQL